MTTINQGEIIFWNGEYGFIKVNDAEESIFFHASHVNEDYTHVQLLDHVSFKVGKSKNPRHLGDPVAYRIKFVERGDYAKHRRAVGQLKGWNGRFGCIYSEQLDKATLFYHTRLARGNHALNDGDYLVFSPVKSSKNPDDQFAFFAYPLHTELDNQFLLALWKDSSLSAVGEVILLKNKQEEFLSVSQRFEIELELLLNLRDDYYYTPIKALINAYKKEFTPEYDRLKLFLTEDVLIQLWEDKVIDTYNLEQLKSYFYRVSAPTKRAIISRFTTEDQEVVLEYFFDRLMRKGGFRMINNDLKTFLDLICRNPETEQLALLGRAELSLYQHLAPTDIIELWLKGYINTPPLTFLQENLSINDLNRWQDPDGKLTSHLQKIVEDYFANIRFQFSFDEEYDQIIIALMFLKSIDKPLYEKWLTAVNTQLQAAEKFILWLFFPEDFFSAETYISINYQHTDPFWIIQYLLVINGIGHSIDDSLEALLLSVISEPQLIESVKEFKWNKLIRPIVENDDFSFVKQLKRFLEVQPNTIIDLRNVSKVLFYDLPAYRVEHLRLWLYEYVPEDFIDYQGFRQLFRKLNKKEQRIYRRKGNSFFREEIEYAERLAVTPCTDVVIHEDNKNHIYNARIDNIHFTQGGWALRREDGNYTKLVENEISSSVFNRLPVTGPLGAMEFVIIVAGQRILNDTVINKLFNTIHSAEIQAALGDDSKSPRGSKTTQDEAYTEDWKLRKQIITYLHTQQLAGTVPVMVEEAKALYRRLDENTPSKDITIEKTQIFTLDLGDDYLLIWENTDLSEDRATFLFKTTPDNYPNQLNKIVEYITTSAQLRSTLVSTSDDPYLAILRNHLGFIGKIHKARGKVDAFESWLKKLENHQAASCPVLPAQRQLDQLEGWQLPQTEKYGMREPIKIKEEDLVTIDPSTIGVKGGEKKPSIAPKQKLQREQILKSLQEINAILNP